MNSFQDSDFIEGIRIIHDLPKGLSKKEIEKRLGEKIKLVHLVITTWETIGLLAFNREISLAMVDNAYSGPIFFSWDELEKYIVEIRIVLQRETPFESFQW